MQNNITVATHAGFCFGVKRATDTVEQKLAEKRDNEKIYTLGHLIHNEGYINWLAERGALSIKIEDIERVCNEANENSPVTVYIRAHGIPVDVENLLMECKKKNKFFNYVDLTCPYVKKIHKIARDNSGEENVFALLGSRAHPEVVGIMSYAEGEKYVFESADEFEEFLKNDSLSKLHKKTLNLAAQTTQNLSEWEKSLKIAKNYCTNSIFFDTICKVTEIRQNEAKKLANECDFIVVVGGRESSNTAKLYKICKEACEQTLWVEKASELDRKFPTNKKIGIVAGASTPKRDIEEVLFIMSEIMTENFAELLEQSLKTLNTGDTVTGYVTHVTDAELQLDLGAKVTGIIKAEQITDDASVRLTQMFNIGDEVEAFVIRVSDIEGVAELSKKRTDSDRHWKNIVALKESGEVVSGKVLKAVAGGLTVQVGATNVFVPASHSGLAKDADLTTLVGQTVDLKIIEIKEQGKRAIGSIRVVLNAQKRALVEEFWANIEEGKQYTGVVRSLTSYGAFIDLGGVDGMVHVSELSWRPIKHPSAVVAVGDVITVFVKSFDKETKRISLGYKTDDTNPWLLFTNTYNVGDVVSVKIGNMMPFGAFAEIMEDVDGLIHISKIANKRIGKPSDVLEIGQVVDAKIIEIDNEKQKISLSIRALLEEEVAEEEAAPAEEVVEEDAPEAVDAE
ncbi:MAG: bifunctional 4-hydroxy-3-methylbut-2-enyl diphosphate reductase/30S ribosomal protein S1 [Clostridia bacterium]|nr:bifunctional 4-hydroxy-3-methylbut-2-enyl diphosphate reductase/30S ribosomal protein S1 [Clostridia bacterium]